jgi:archaeal cell division control protein 6
MNVFDSMLKHDETLFRNEIVLDYDYLPHVLKFRESKQQHIATIIKPLLDGRTGGNLIILGKPGIGKTAACKHVLRDLEKFSDKVKGLYINCWKHDSSHKIALAMCDQLGYKWTQNKNTNELLKEIASVLNKRTAVIVFDEADKLKEEQIVYNLLEDIFKKSIIMIANEKDFYSYLDQRTRSRLVPEMLEFDPYSLKETYDILIERANIAYFDGVFDIEHFDRIVEKTCEVGDIRTGLFLLKECGNAAEMRSSRKIEQQDIEKALNKISSFMQSKVILDESEKEVLELIRENNGKLSTEICVLFVDKTGKSERTFRRRVTKLKSLNLVQAKDGKDSQGKIVPELYLKKI